MAHITYTEYPFPRYLPQPHTVAEKIRPYGFAATNNGVLQFLDAVNAHAGDESVNAARMKILALLVCVLFCCFVLVCVHASALYQCLHLAPPSALRRRDTLAAWENPSHRARFDRE